MAKRHNYLGGAPIDPKPITGQMTVAELVEQAFLAYNAARLREACQLFVEKMLEAEVTIGMSLTGALTPAGLGMSAIIPLIDNGFVDWIVSTGANLYHDTHFGIGLKMHRGNPQTSDLVLREEGVVRIYDIFFEYDVLLSTDEFYRQMIEGPEFQRDMSTAEFHYLAGKYIAERERVLGIGRKSLLAAAYAASVPVYTSSPGDSSIGMNVAAKALTGDRLRIGPLGSTRMMCSPDRMDQEVRFFQALATAERCELSKGELLIVYAGGTLRFAPIGMNLLSLQLITHELQELADQQPKRETEPQQKYILCSI